MNIYQIVAVVIGSLLLLFLIILFTISFYVTKKIVYPHRYTKENKSLTIKRWVMIKASIFYLEIQ
ncbi:MAG: hypothetical protein WC123_05600 [Bacilli bacterium]